MSATKPGALARAKAAWGDALPDWVARLGAACDETSLTQVAGRSSYSPATLSYVINNRYAGDLTAVEQDIRGTLMNRTVMCPVLGEIPANACIANQRAPFSAHNPQRVATYRACRSGCSNSRLTREAKP